MASKLEEIPGFDRNTADVNIPDFHAVVTITLGELIYDNVIRWDDKSGAWDFYNEEQYSRICGKIQNRYWDREISILPVNLWKKEFLRIMNEIMPKYKLLYAKIDESGLNFMQTSNNYGKDRTINSSFPQTQLSGESDYASSGKDNEFEKIKDGDVLGKLQEFEKNYKDVDVMVLDELETLFSPFLALNVNAF